MQEQTRGNFPPSNHPAFYSLFFGNRMLILSPPPQTKRIRNKAKLKAQELVDPRNTALRNILQKAEFAIMAGDDVVDEDDNGPTGSASDSD